MHRISRLFLLLIAGLLLPAQPVCAQDSFEKAFQVTDLFLPANTDVVNALAQQQFSTAASKARTYLGRKDLTRTQQANLRYMHLMAVAGCVLNGQKNRAELGTLLTAYAGKELISQALIITTGGGQPFNQLMPSKMEGTHLDITCSNDAGTGILGFVSVDLLRVFPLAPHSGKHGYVCGVLHSSKLSDPGVNSWIMKLNLVGGFIRILEDEFH